MQSVFEEVGKPNGWDVEREVVGRKEKGFLRN